jgi:polysaccharide export outer membrane protein
MGRFLPTFLIHLVTLVLAGLLLFAALGHAHAQDNKQYDNYGLKRFPGDNYDTVPARPPVSAPYTTAPNIPALAAPQPYAPAPAQADPAPAPQAAASAPPYGYKQVAPAAPTYPTQRVANTQPAPAGDIYGTYRQRGVAGFDYVLGIGDKLKLTVFGEPDLSGDFTIDGSGYVRLPLVGEVRAAGYTSQQLEGAIANAMSGGYLKSPRVAVEVSIYRPFYIIGAVNRPGQYPYVEHMNALNAVALAGGFLPTAVESVVFIRREGSNSEEEVPVDRTTPIYPGDVVKVHTTVLSDVVSILSPFSGIASTAATAAVIN